MPAFDSLCLCQVVLDFFDPENETLLLIYTCNMTESRNNFFSNMYNYVFLLPEMNLGRRELPRRPDFCYHWSAREYWERWHHWFNSEIWWKGHRISQQKDKLYRSGSWCWWKQIVEGKGLLKIVEIVENLKHINFINCCESGGAGRTLSFILDFWFPCIFCSKIITNVLLLNATVY